MPFPLDAERFAVASRIALDANTTLGSPTSLEPVACATSLLHTIAVPLDFSNYDSRHYKTVAVKEGYGLWSKTYDDRPPDRMDLDLLDRLSVDWQVVEDTIDLACGTGRIGQWLKTRGVETLDGADFTPEMLAIARARKIYRDLRQEDMRKTSFDGAKYDVAVNSLSQEHIPDLVAAYQETARLLRPGGHFICVNYHPFFLIEGIPTHFKHDDCNVAVTNYIHLISDHVSAAHACGFTLVEMHERIVDAAWLEADPRFERHGGKPISFVAVWRLA